MGNKRGPFSLSNSLSVQRLQEEFNDLREQQIEALRKATFVGMTGREAKQYDARHRRITAVAKALNQPESSLDDQEKT